MVYTSVDHEWHDRHEHDDVGHRRRQLHAKQNCDDRGNDQDRNELDADQPDDGLAELGGNIGRQRHLGENADQRQDDGEL